MYRLSPTAIPKSYDLEIKPNLDDFTFEGTVSITLQVPTPTSVIELNAKDLTVTSASVRGGDGNEQVLQVAHDNEHEILTLQASTVIDAGTTVVDIAFSGELKDDLAGFYRSSYQDASGETRYIATTQFESTDARKAFPCFDEPDLKATFKIHLVVPRHLEAISNYPVSLVEEVSPTEKRITFEETMPISTYLVAFIVGPFRSPKVETTTSGVPVRVLSIEGSHELSEFAYDVALHAVKFFEDWFEIPYPAPKLDLIAIPDFGAGAMENLGAVTFREALLLVDQRLASKAELERVADVICHEIAHMWFGDLATMKWWNGIWLNEAFATYMELVACNAFRPSWKRWDSFGISRLEAMDIDALPSTRPIEYPVVSPSDAEEMFDLLTYEKGASVLKMIQEYLGVDRFRAGVSLYLDRYRLSNAETTDLWSCIEEASGEPMNETMRSWVFQGGHPLITASLENNRIQLSQEPFRYLNRSDDPQGSIGSAWLVPIKVRADGQEHTVLLQGPTLELEVGGGIEDVYVNADGFGVFRTMYKGELRDKAISGYGQHSVTERFNLISDSWALVLSERDTLKNYISLLRASAIERDPNVLRLIYSSISLLNRIADSDQKEAVSSLVRELFSPIILELGTEEGEEESEEQALARAIAFEALGVISNDKEIGAKANELFRMDISGLAPIPPNLASATLRVVATQGDDSDFAFMLDRYRNPRDPQDKLRNLYAVTAFRSPTLSLKVAEMCKGEIRIQDAFIVLANLIANPFTGDRVIAYVIDNFAELSARFPEKTRPSIFRTVPLLCTETSAPLASRVEQFFADNPMPSGKRNIAQQLERYRLNLRLRENYGSRLANELS
jgi:puromycin-sensitive aminopeptidase